MCTALLEVNGTRPVREHLAEFDTDDSLDTRMLGPVPHGCGVGPGQVTKQGGSVRLSTTPSERVLTRSVAPRSPSLSPGGDFSPVAAPAGATWAVLADPKLKATVSQVLEFLQLRKVPYERASASGWPCPTGGQRSAVSSLQTPPPPGVISTR